MTGYFMLVDRDQVGDIGPDMNLPDPCTAIDTSYSVAIRARGLRLGLVPHVCYHTKKEVWAQKDIIHKVERYLLAKWGMFYWDCVQYTGVRSPVAGRGQLAAGATRSALMSNKSFDTAQDAPLISLVMIVKNEAAIRARRWNVCGRSWMSGSSWTPAARTGRRRSFPSMDPLRNGLRGLRHDEE